MDDFVNAPLYARTIPPREGGATFAFKHRLFRAVWGLVWHGLGAWTPSPMFGWRRFLAIAFGARIAPDAKIYPGVRIWYPPNLVMGAHACLAEGVNCYCMAPIALEAYALVSQRAHLCAGSHDVDDPDFPLRVKPIRIAENAWVAAEAFVGPGVVVGEGAVLGARAVAFRSLEPWSLYVGNPAKRLRARKGRPTSESGEPAS